MMDWISARQLDQNHFGIHFVVSLARMYNDTLSGLLSEMHSKPFLHDSEYVSARNIVQEYVQKAVRVFKIPVRKVSESAVRTFVTTL